MIYHFILNINVLFHKKFVYTSFNRDINRNIPGRKNGQNLLRFEYFFNRNNQP